MTEPSQSEHPFIVRDGSNHPYEVVGYQATFTLRSTLDGSIVSVGSETLRTLGIEFDGRTLKQVG